MTIEEQRTTLLLGLQAILQAEQISNIGATTTWDTVENKDGTWVVRVVDTKGVVELFKLADSDGVCLDAGLVAEDFTKRMVGRINAALDLARTSLR